MSDGQEADAHRVDEAVRGVDVVEHDLAADVRDADRVAVGADAADRAREVVVGGAEAEAVEERDRPRAHRDDVAQDAADAGRGALERLDGRGVVVALGLEGDGEPVAEVEHAGVLARALQHARAAARQPLQEQRRVLVAAVLRPEEREDGQLEVVRLALQQLLDTRVLPVREAELAVKWLFRDRAQDVSLAAAPDGPPAGARLQPTRAPHTRDVRCDYRHDAVTRRDALLLLLLSSIWGSSFLFIKLGVESLEPSVVAFGRLVLGALTLLALAARAAAASTPLRGHLVPIVVLGALNNAIPFWLLGFAETHLDSGLTAVIQAAAPIFTVILASRIDVTQRVTGAAADRRRGRVRRRRPARRRPERRRSRRGARRARRRALLRDVRPLRRPHGAQRSRRCRCRSASSPAPRCCSRRSGSASCPATAPPAKVWLAVLALGVLGSGIAYLLYFAIIASAGASRAILVTYLVPAFALAYGAVFLDEAITAIALAGLALVLTGTALATGLARGADG